MISGKSVSVFFHVINRYSDNEPIMNNCEECHVIPEDLLIMLMDKMEEIGETREGARRKIKTYLEGSSTTQGHMAMVTSDCSVDGQ